MLAFVCVASGEGVSEDCAILMSVVWIGEEGALIV